MILSKAQILAAQDRPTETVEVPEWGGSVLVACMTGTDRDHFEANIVTVDGRANLHDLRAKLAAACIVDESGNRLFSDAEVQALGGKSFSALDRVVMVAQRLNKLGDQALEELKGN